MNKIVTFLILAIFTGSCETKPTLQKYYVKNTESADFISVDLAPSIINTSKIKLTNEDKAALESFEKMNILAFKADATNSSKYDKEIKEVKAILKDESYQQLIKAGSGNDGAAIYFVGNDDEHIEEFVVLAGKKENGFAVVRVLGNDMNPTNIINMMNLLQKSNLDLEQLKPLQQLMK